MKKDILTQKITIAEVTVHKNYSTLSDEPIKNILDQNKNYIEKIDKSLVLRITKDKKHKNFLYNNNDDVIICNLSPVYLGSKKTFHILDTDPKFFKYYKNPFVLIKIMTIYRTIKKNGTRISFTFYIKNRVRNVNQKYFVTKTTRSTFVFDLKYGNILIGDTNRIRCNNLRNMYSFLHNFEINNTNFLINYTRFLSSKISSPKVLKQLENKFNDDLFDNTTKEVLGSQIRFKNYDHAHKDILELFVKVKGLKVPDNYEYYLKNYYPKSKILKDKSVNNNLIRGIMRDLGLSGKYFVKLFNTNHTLNVYHISKFCKNILNETNGKMFSMLNNDAILYFFNNTNINISLLYDYDYIVNIEHKSQNILMIMNEFVDLKKTTPNTQYKLSLRMIYDHFEMINKLNMYGIRVTTNSTSLNGFFREHEEFSKKLSLINLGGNTNIIYNKELLDNIEGVINIEKNIFDVKILKSTNEYIDEGQYMRHCVGSYINYNSVIISIRTRNKKEGVTLEFGYNGELRQEASFCNMAPDVKLIKPINIISTKIKELYENDKMILIPLKKEKENLIIDGVSIKEREPAFDDILLF